MGEAKAATKPKAICVKIIIYLHLATLCNIRSMWNWTYEPVGFRCDHPFDPLQPNNSKIKVLVYGLPKTGTTQTSRTLRNFWNNSWHSEEFMFHLWAPHSDAFWAKPENGGGFWPFQRLATPGHPAYHGHSFYPRQHLTRPADQYVLNHTTDAELVYKFQKCAVDSMTFDGYEDLFWRIYDMSPDAKVLILDWRTYKQWVKSMTKFGIWVYAALIMINYCNVGIHFLPWMAIINPINDWLNGYRFTEIMTSGGKLLDIGSTGFLLMRMSITERRFINHWCSGFGQGVSVVQSLATADEAEELYQKWFDEAKERIPADRRISFSVAKNTTNDLCKFLGLEGHPQCNDEPLPKDAPVLLAHEMEYPWSIPPTIPLFAFVHTVNYRICWGVLNAIGALLAKLAGKCGIRCRKKRKSKKA